MADAIKKEFAVSARNVRMSAQKARYVMDVVRGRGALEAATLLQFINKRAAPAVKKLIESAVANAEEYGNRNGIDMELESLVICEARVDEGPRMKRWRPRSRGMANPFTRRTCHLFVTLADADLVAEKKAGRPAWRKPRQRLSREERLIKVGRMEAPAPEAKKPAPAAKQEPQSHSAAPAEQKAAEPKAEKAPAKKAEAKAEKPEAKAEKKPAKKAEKKAEKKADTKAEKSDKKPAKKAEKKDSKKKK